MVLVSETYVTVSVIGSSGHIADPPAAPFEDILKIFIHVPPPR
jgi:hypothetical protein